jgi:hypothetical protein
MPFVDLMKLLAWVVSAAGIIMCYQGWPTSDPNLPEPYRLAMIQAAAAWAAAGLFGGIMVYWMARLLQAAEAAQSLLDDLVSFEHKRRADAARAKATPAPSQLARTPPH